MSSGLTAMHFVFLSVMVGALQQSEWKKQEVVPSEPFAIVPLRKQYVPIQRNNVTVAFKTAYFGDIHVGIPAQHFSVVFDTGSAHVIIPSTGCKSETCKGHRRYDRSQSETGLQVSHGKDDAPDHVSISFGTGEVMGNVVHELVCLNPKDATLEEFKVQRDQLLGPSSNAQVSDQAPSRDDCTLLRMVMAKMMTDEPFNAFEFDGILGLGLECLALHPDFSFFGRLSSEHVQQRQLFGLYLSQSDAVTSEIAFGGVDTRHIASPLQWANVVNADLGYWQVRIRGVRVGDKRLDICDGPDGCAAIVDTGTSLFGVPESSLKQLHLLLVREVPDSQDSLESSDPDCREVPGPDLVFDMGDFELTLSAKDYSRESVLRIRKPSDGSTQAVCRAALLKIGEMPPLSSKTFIFGEPLLRRYYTAYDWTQQRVGFATAVQSNTHEVIGEADAVNTSEV